jgi:hypothetical protein
MMTKQEAFEAIIEVIQTQNIERNYLNDDYGDADTSKLKTEVKNLFENAKSVDHHGGEGQGEDYWTVWHFPNPDIYIEFYGWYSSDWGTEFQGMNHVMPTQVMRTEYVSFKP